MKQSLCRETFNDTEVDLKILEFFDDFTLNNIKKVKLNHQNEVSGC